MSTNPAPYNQAQLLTDLKQDEGYRLKPYLDTVKKISIGIGRNLSDVGLSDIEVMSLYNNDIAVVTACLDTHIIWWRTKPDNIQRALINLCFNMGWTKFSAFTTFLKMVEADDIEGACSDLQDTAWFDQVGLRGPRMIARLREGTVPP